jgi:hypothetical protein
VVDMIFMRDHSVDAIVDRYNIDRSSAHNLRHRFAIIEWLDHFNAHDGKLKPEFRYLYPLDFKD